MRGHRTQFTWCATLAALGTYVTLSAQGAPAAKPQSQTIRGRVLDLYAGTGSLGIECLSRGAAWADFVEQRSNVCRIIRENLEHTRLLDRARVNQMPVGRYLATAHPAEKYAIILMDPPYADPAIRAILGQVAEGPLLAPEGLLVVGHATTVTLPDAPGPLRRIRQRTFGGSAFSLYKYAAAAGSADPGEADALPGEDDEETC